MFAPSMKNVAVILCLASRASTCGVYRGSGPSSMVSAMTFGPSVRNRCGPGSGGATLELPGTLDVVLPSVGSDELLPGRPPRPEVVPGPLDGREPPVGCAVVVTAGL